MVIFLTLSNMKNRHGGLCGICRWVLPLILSLTAFFLLLVNLGALTGDFGNWVARWWPAGLLLFAIGGFCPCPGRKGNCCPKCGKCGGDCEC